MSVESPSAIDWSSVAASAIGVIPAAEPLSVLSTEVADQTVGPAEALSPFAGAAVADLASPASGRIAVLVTEEVVSALAGGPLGALALASALQPAFDALGESLGGAAEVGREVSMDDLADELGPGFTIVTLGADETSAAVVFSDAVVPAPASGATTPAPEPNVTVVAKPAAGGLRGLEMLHGVVMDVTVELGRTKLPVRELLALAPGTVVELDRAAGAPADLLVNGRLIARGEVVVVDEDFGLRITEILDAGAGA